MNFPIFKCNYKINSVTSDGTKPHTHTVTSEIIQTFESEGNVLINGKLYNMEKNNLTIAISNAIGEINNKENGEN